MVPVLLVLLGTVRLRAGLLPDKTPSLFPPVNFTVEVTGLAQVLLRWEPNPNQEWTSVKLGYHVKISVPEDDDYEVQYPESRRVTILHRGFSASVRTICWEDPALPASGWVSAELPAPAGAPGTAAVNLTCTTNTAADSYAHARPYWVSLHCAWLAGEEAPADTQYFLYYRYGSRTEECQNYSQDALERNTACWFPRTAIDSKGRSSLAVHVNGSSRHAAIKPYDQLFDLHAIDQVNPPVNVTAELQGTRLSIQWEKPVSAFPAQCFDYEVKIHNTRTGYFQTEKMTSNEFTSVINAMCKYSVEVRAAVSFVCRQTGLWSAWSRPAYVGREEQEPRTEWFLIALLAAICFLLSPLVCGRCHLWTKLFPPVPAPKNNIQDFVAGINYEKTGSGETESEVIHYVGDRELEVLEDLVF